MMYDIGIQPEILNAWRTKTPPGFGLVHYPDGITCDVPIEITPILLLSGTVKWRSEQREYCYHLRGVTTRKISIQLDEVIVDYSVFQKLKFTLTKNLGIELLYGVYPVMQEGMSCVAHGKVRRITAD